MPSFPYNELPATCKSPPGVNKTVWLFEETIAFTGKSLSCSTFLGRLISPSTVEFTPMPSSPSVFLPQAHRKAFLSTISSVDSSRSYFSWVFAAPGPLFWLRSFSIADVDLFREPSLFGSIERGDKSLVFLPSARLNKPGTANEF